MKKVFQVDGLECGHCANRLQSALLTINGINNAYVDEKKQTATLQFTFEVDDNVIKDAVEEQGFEYKGEIKES